MRQIILATETTGLSGGTGTRDIPRIGPASIFSTTFTIQTPVNASPFSSARATGSGPRYFGSSDG